MVPDWNTSALAVIPKASDFLTTVWLTIPVIIFSFNHSAAISSLVQSQKQNYASRTPYKVNSILFRTSALLLIFVMFFVFSCVMALSPADLAQAKLENISILSYLANQYDNPVYSYAGPLIAFAAITSSFFGHYLGAREGLEGLIHQSADAFKMQVNCPSCEIMWRLILLFHNLVCGS